MRLEPLGHGTQRAEAIFEQGREAVVAVLLALSAQIAAQDVQIAKLAARVAEHEQRLKRNSRSLARALPLRPPIRRGGALPRW